jgi:hypothetical protein
MVPQIGLGEEDQSGSRWLEGEYTMNTRQVKRRDCRSELPDVLVILSGLTTQLPSRKDASEESHAYREILRWRLAVSGAAPSTRSE